MKQIYIVDFSTKLEKCEDDSAKQKPLGMVRSFQE